MQDPTDRRPGESLIAWLDRQWSDPRQVPIPDEELRLHERAPMFKIPEQTRRGEPHARRT